MLLEQYHGYSVRSRDLSGISFESESLNDCKRWCRDDSVIVELIPIKCGFNFRVWLCDYNGGVEYDKYSHCLTLWKLRIQCIPEYKHKVGKIVYDPLKEK